MLRQQNNKIRVGIMGVTGYAGEELIKILINHKFAEIKCLYSRTSSGKKISEIYPFLKGKLDLLCDNNGIDYIAKNCNFVFLALPHAASMDFVPVLLKNGVKVVDLSADYRLSNADIYEKWYSIPHKDKRNLKLSVYGLTELNRTSIKKGKIIANPGCYPTAAILALAPLLKNKLISAKDVIIDAKSGFSGAGRKNDLSYLSETKNSFKAYAVGKHRHMPEIEEQLSRIYGKKLSINFTAHLLPLERGILETIYVKKAASYKLKASSLNEMYKKFYKNEPFVNILGAGNFPELKNVVNTNNCEIGLVEDSHSITIVSAIDNLLKGASGQAVQNMNVMCGFKETEGLV